MSPFTKKIRIIKAILVLLTPILVALFPSGKAFACSCVMPGTPEEEFKQFDAVFMGTVTSINEREVPASIPTETSWSYPRVQLGINVGRSWKGVTTDFVYVSTGYGDGDCGYQGTAFQTYLFYASGPIDDLHISICSRTALYREAQEDRSYLEQLQELPLTKAMPANVESSDNNQSTMTTFLGGSTLVLLIVISYLFVVNQRIRKKIDGQK